MTVAKHHSRRIGRATMCFVVASFLDYLMTWALLSRPVDSHGIQFVEGNPVAGYFLTAWGTFGLAGFKMAMVALVTVVCWIIASQRVVAARRILEFAAVVGSAVVIYSAGLAMRHL